MDFVFVELDFVVRQEKSHVNIFFHVCLPSCQFIDAIQALAIPGHDECGPADRFDSFLTNSRILERTNRLGKKEIGLPEQADQPVNTVNLGKSFCTIDVCKAVTLPNVHNTVCVSE